MTFAGSTFPFRRSLRDTARQSIRVFTKAHRPGNRASLPVIAFVAALEVLHGIVGGLTGRQRLVWPNVSPEARLKLPLQKAD